MICFYQSFLTLGDFPVNGYVTYFYLLPNRGTVRVWKYKRSEVMTTAKDATVKSRINTDLKDKVDKVLNSLGMTSSEAIRLFYNQIAMRQEFPLELKIPNQETAHALNAPLEEKGYDNVDQLFDDVLNEKD